MTVRDRIIIIVVLALAALGAFWFLGLSPKRKEAADLQVKIGVAAKQLSDADVKASQARQAKARYNEDYAVVAGLGKAVPKSDALPSLIFQLQAAARRERINFNSLKVTASGAVAAAPSPAAATADAKGSSAAPASTSSSASPSTGTPSTPTSAPATQAASAALPPGATIGSAGLPTMPFSFVFNGTFFDMERFLHDVQGFVRVDGQRIAVTGRLLSVDAVSLTAGPGGFPNVKASINATAYILSPTDGASTATSGTASAGAAATPAPTSSLVQR